MVKVRVKFPLLPLLLPSLCVVVVVVVVVEEEETKVEAAKVDILRTTLFKQLPLLQTVSDMRRDS